MFEREKIIIQTLIDKFIIGSLDLILSDPSPYIPNSFDCLVIGLFAFTEAIRNNPTMQPSILLSAATLLSSVAEASRRTVSTFLSSGSPSYHH